uniref:hypothetical protein n=1 Tax=uncultured Tenacibaculum sp. TaxID=174713 RepID=UPI00260E55EF|nr:hypothetical protein [uncultured Tenacibaculum sp.]
MVVSQISKDNINITNNEKSVYKAIYQGIKYTLVLKELTEIRMSVYVYFDVKFYKDNTVMLSGEMPQPDKYYNPFSPNNRYVNMPLRKNGGIIDLSTGAKCSSSVGWLGGNIFNQASTKMIVNAVRQFKVMDLEHMESCYHAVATDGDLMEAFFLNNDTIAHFIDGSTLEVHHLKTNTKNVIKMPSPFEKFDVNPNTYQTLIDKQIHCLALPSGAWHTPYCLINGSI